MTGGITMSLSRQQCAKRKTAFLGWQIASDASRAGALGS